MMITHTINDDIFKFLDETWIPHTVVARYACHYVGCSLKGRPRFKMGTVCTNCNVCWNWLVSVTSGECKCMKDITAYFRLK